MRAMRTQYVDPADTIWITTAAQLGMRVVRSAEVFAAWDGAGMLTLDDGNDFDPDDSVAQLVFHEICHALVEGPEKFAVADWGLCNWTGRDVVREYACHRLQAALSAPHGLRWVLAPTTIYRPYYEALPADPLADANDPALEPARVAFRRATTGPWATALQAALEATAAVGRAVQPFAPAESLWARFDPPSTR